MMKFNSKYQFWIVFFSLLNNSRLSDDFKASKCVRKQPNNQNAK